MYRDFLVKKKKTKEQGVPVFNANKDSDCTVPNVDGKSGVEAQEQPFRREAAAVKSDIRQCFTYFRRLARCLPNARLRYQRRKTFQASPLRHDNAFRRRRALFRS